MASRVSQFGSILQKPYKLLKFLFSFSRALKTSFLDFAARPAAKKPRLEEAPASVEVEETPAAEEGEVAMTDAGGGGCRWLSDRGGREPPWKGMCVPYEGIGSPGVGVVVPCRFVGKIEMLLL